MLANNIHFIVRVRILQSRLGLLENHKNVIKLRPYNLGIKVDSSFQEHQLYQNEHGGGMDSKPQKVLKEQPKAVNGIITLQEH